MISNPYFSPCVFSQGAPFNNRSLLPCQDHPTIIATWQASIKLRSGYTATMSSNSVWSEQADGSYQETYV